MQQNNSTIHHGASNSNRQILQETYLLMPYNFYVWLRKEFVMICKDDAEALIMRVVEYEIEADRRIWLRQAEQSIEQGKEIPEEPEWWVTLSHNQIMTRLYDETIKDERTLRQKLTSLTQVKRYLLMRPDDDNPYGSPQYTINRSLVQAKLDALPPLKNVRGGPPKNVRGDLPKMSGGDLPKMSGGDLPKMSPLIRKKKEENITERKREDFSKERNNNSPQDDSLSLSPSNSFSSLSSLPEEEVLSEEEEEFPSEEYEEDDSLSSQKEKLRKKKKDMEEFFDRWQAINGGKDESQNPTAQKHAETLINDHLNNTSDIQGLYDLASQKIEEYAASQNRKPLPPALGNLVKVIPEYRSLKGRQASQEKRRHFTPGAGYTKPEEEEQKKERIPLRYATPEERKQINSIVVGGARDRQKEERARLIREKIQSKRNVGTINMGDFGALGEIARRRSENSDEN